MRLLMQNNSKASQTKIHTHTNMQTLSSIFYLKQNSMQVVLFKYALESLLGYALGGVFSKILSYDNVLEIFV